MRSGNPASIPYAIATSAGRFADSLQGWLVWKEVRSSERSSEFWFLFSAAKEKPTVPKQRTDMRSLKCNGSNLFWTAKESKWAESRLIVNPAHIHVLFWYWWISLRLLCPGRISYFAL